MTIKEAQELVEAWAHKHPTQDSCDLKTMTQISENIYGLMSKTDVNSSEISKEVSQMIWLMIDIANRANIDVTAAIIDNLEQKNSSI